MIAAAVHTSARDLLNRAKDQLQKGDKTKAAESLAKVQEFSNLSQLTPVEQSVLADLRLIVGNPTLPVKRRSRPRKKS